MESIERMAFSRPTIDAAVKHLRVADPVMRNVIRQVGPFTLKPGGDRFAMLVRSIISQQISTKAARSIRQRLQDLCPDQKLTAENLSRFDPDELRTAGVSPQKARYIGELCVAVVEERLRLRQLGRFSDEAVIEQLIQVKGIGRWTAQMFLIFALGRLDVFPHDDLGIRTAIRNLYGLDDLPDKQASHEIAEPWRPYASVASWYCWRSGDLQ